MHPMTATVTPGKCPVASWIPAVVSCKSNNVRPQDGQETNSVFVLRMRLPCSKLNDVRRKKSTENGFSSPTCSIMIPSPLPSVKSEPILVPTCRASSLASFVLDSKWCITAVSISLLLKSSNTRRAECRWDNSDFGLRNANAGCKSLTLAIVSSSSDPSMVTANRIAPSGSFPPLAIASVRSIKATALGKGSFSSTSAGTTTPMFTSIKRRKAVWDSVSELGGTVRIKIESVVATSLKGIPTAVLHPRSWYKYCALLPLSISGVTGEITEPAVLRNPLQSTASPSSFAGKAPCRRANVVISRVSL
mmetsp:Transcript_94035/g.251777  ORF Transcript_94035/g.251777 Transcript_94035/m.251777 type:complete len:305 (+) Transcript_94035:257-1171(+)